MSEMGVRVVKTRNSYCAYITYKLTDLIHDQCLSNTYLISEFFGLPTTRGDGEPSYTYAYNNDFAEIGIECQKLEILHEKIKSIVIAIENKGGTVMDLDLDVDTDDRDWGI